MHLRFNEQSFFIIIFVLIVSFANVTCLLSWPVSGTENFIIRNQSPQFLIHEPGKISIAAKLWALRYICFFYI
jgi:hypothetical protein